MEATSPISDVVLYEKPHPRLQPFVSHYVFRNIHFPQDHFIQKAMPIHISSSIDFFIGDPFETIDYHTGQFLPFHRCTIRGPRTRKLYYIRLKGHFISFTIKLKPTALYRLTGIPAHTFTNCAIPGKEITPLPLQEITSKLLKARNISTCIKTIEPYLFFAAEKSKYQTDATEKVAQQLAGRKSELSVAALATENNLCLRQLERTFLKEIGVSPKTLSRMSRFERLLKSRMNDPSTKWSAIAYDFGYYDQMHLIRDFRQFLDISPSAFEPADFAL